MDLVSGRASGTAEEVKTALQALFIEYEQSERDLAIIQAQLVDSYLAKAGAPEGLRESVQRKLLRYAAEAADVDPLLLAGLSDDEVGNIMTRGTPDESNKGP